MQTQSNATSAGESIQFAAINARDNFDTRKTVDTLFGCPAPLKRGALARHFAKLSRVLTAYFPSKPIAERRYVAWMLKYCEGVCGRTLLREVGSDRRLCSACEASTPWPRAAEASR
jgi:hypothetical protein